MSTFRLLDQFEAEGEGLRPDLSPLGIRDDDEVN